MPYYRTISLRLVHSIRIRFTCWSVWGRLRALHHQVAGLTIQLLKRLIILSNWRSRYLQSKSFLRQRMQSPPGLINDAINRLVKGCEIHMNSAILLSKEVQDLRVAMRECCKRSDLSDR